MINRYVIGTVVLSGLIILLGAFVYYYYDGYQDAASTVTALARANQPLTTEMIEELQREADFKSQEIDAVKEKIAEIEGDLDSAKEELGHIETELRQRKETGQKSVQTFNVVNPKQNGSRIAYYWQQDRTLYLGNLDVNSLEPIYQLPEGYHLVDFDVTSDDRLALIIEKSSGEGAAFENRVQVLFIDTLAPERTAQVILNQQSRYGEQYFIAKRVYFAGEGKYLVVEKGGWEWENFSVYSTSTLEDLMKPTAENQDEWIWSANYLKLHRFGEEGIYFEAAQMGAAIYLYKYDLETRQLTHYVTEGHFSNWQFIVKDEEIYLYSRKFEGNEKSLIQIPKF